MRLRIRGRSNPNRTFSTAEASRFLHMDVRTIARRSKERLFGAGGTLLGGRFLKITERGLAYALAQRPGWNEELAAQAVQEYKRNSTLPPSPIGDTARNAASNAANGEVTFATGQVAQFLGLSNQKVRKLFKSGAFGKNGARQAAPNEHRRYTPAGLVHVLTVDLGWDQESAERAVAEYVKYVLNTLLLVETDDESVNALAQEQLASMGHSYEIVKSTFEAGSRAFGTFRRSVAMISEEGNLIIYMRHPRPERLPSFGTVDYLSHFYSPQAYGIFKNPGDRTRWVNRSKLTRFSASPQ